MASVSRPADRSLRARYNSRDAQIGQACVPDKSGKVVFLLLHDCRRPYDVVSVDVAYGESMEQSARSSSEREVLVLVWYCDDSVETVRVRRQAAHRASGKVHCSRLGLVYATLDSVGARRACQSFPKGVLKVHRQTVKRVTPGSAGTRRTGRRLLKGVPMVRRQIVKHSR
jgi:hypothetical protein